MVNDAHKYQMVFLVTAHIYLYVFGKTYQGEEKKLMSLITCSQSLHSMVNGQLVMLSPNSEIKPLLVLSKQFMSFSQYFHDFCGILFCFPFFVLGSA